MRGLPVTARQELEELANVFPSEGGLEHRWLGIFCTNAFQIYDVPVFRSGIFLRVSRINHSCR